MTRSRRLALGLAATLGSAMPTAAAGDIVPADAVINDAAAQVALAETYVRLGDFAAARELYDRILAATDAPSAELLVGAANLRVYNGRPADALPLYRRALALDPSDREARRGLALTLAWTGQKDEALPLLQQLAGELPDDADISTALTSLVPTTDNLGRALELARQRVEKNPDSTSALIELADLEAARGHAAATRSLYARILAIDEGRSVTGFDLRHTRARIGWGDFYGAEAGFRRALAERPSDPGLLTELINLLISMDRLDRAETAALRWLHDSPDSAQAAEVLANVRAKKDPLAAGVPPHPEVLPRTDEAVLALTGGADAYQARGETPPAGLVIPRTAAELQQFAGRYAGQGDFAIAVRCLRAARVADPDYFPARLDLAEFLAINGQYEEAHREFAALAADFPESRQVLLKQARALGWDRRYEDSLDAYAALRELNSADRATLLEQARVATWSKQRDRSANLYAEAWTEPVDLRLAEALARFPKETHPLPATRELLEDLDVEPGAPDSSEPYLATEAFMQEAVDSGDASLADLAFDLRTDLYLQRAFWLENRAKQLAWDARFLESEKTYDRLLAVTPANQEALFDLSQVQAAQGLGHRERDTLGNLLALDANNRLAGRALFRRDRRSEPTLTAAGDHFREKGRGDLSSIRRWRGSLTGEVTIDDRFRFHASLIRWLEDPDTRRKNYYADGFALGGDGVFNERLSGSFEYTHKDYDSNALPTRVTDTGFAQGWLATGTGTRIGLGFERREELANEWALNEGTTSDHRWIGARWDATRRASVEARYDSIAYSDNNDGWHFNLSPAYVWNDHPRTFKTTLSLDWRDTDRDNVYVFTGPVLTDIVHPYWTPQNYFGAALILEWRHDLAREFFIGAPEHWYDIRVSFGIGNDDNAGVSLAADYAREWIDRWLLRAGVDLTESKDWDALRARLSLTYRF